MNNDDNQSFKSRSNFSTKYSNNSNLIVTRRINNNNNIEAKGILKWEMEDVLKWLQKEELSSDLELVNAIKNNKIEGIDLINLTKEDIKDELEIKSLRTRKNLYESIEKLRLSLDNINIQEVCKVLLNDLIFEKSLADTPKEVLETQEKEINIKEHNLIDFKFADELQSYYRKLEEIEIKDVNYANALFRSLNPGKEIPIRRIENNISTNLTNLDQSTFSINSNSTFFGKKDNIKKIWESKTNLEKVITSDTSKVILNSDNNEIKNKIFKKEDSKQEILRFSKNFSNVLTVLMR